MRRFVFPAHERGDYQAALEAIEQYEPSDLDEIVDLAFWRMCLLSRLGRKGEAIAEFEHRVGEDLWWGKTFLADHDLDAVRDDPEWRRVATVSLERAAKAVTGPVEPTELEPDGRAIGTLVLLHGFGWRPNTILDHYRPALAWGYRLVALHGTVPVATGRFAWPAEDAERVVVEQLHGLGDPERPILSGFSQGARVAGHLAWSGRVDASGAFLVAPALGPKGIPTPDTVKSRVPTIILAGDEDRRIDNIRQTVENLEASGVPVRYDERVGLGHEWPDDLAETLGAALEWMRADR